MTSGFSVCLSKVVFEMNHVRHFYTFALISHQWKVLSEKKKLISPHPPKHPPKHPPRGPQASHLTVPPSHLRTWLLSCILPERFLVPSDLSDFEVRFMGRISGFLGFCLPRETLEEPYVNLRVKTSLNVCGLRDRWNLQSLAVFGPFKRGDVVPWSNYSYFGQVLRTQTTGWVHLTLTQKPHLQPHHFVAIHP